MQLKNEAEDAARAKAEQQVADAHKESQRLLEEAAQRLQGEMEMLAQEAREKQPEAIKVLLKELA